LIFAAQPCIICFRIVVSRRWTAGYCLSAAQRAGVVTKALAYSLSKTE